MFLSEPEDLLPCVRQKMSISHEKIEHTREGRRRVTRGMAGGCSIMESDTKRIWFEYFSSPERDR